MCFIFGFILWLLSCWPSTASAQLFQQEIYDYCDPKLKLCDVVTDHTMCKYPSPGLSSHCTPSIHEPLSATEKKRILFWHNKFRSNIANASEKNKNRKLPTSSNMRQLLWDKELESLAIRWAEQCANSSNPYPYDKCRNTKRFQVSQNIGTRKVNASSIDKQAPQFVVSWYKESKDFDPALVDKFVLPGDGKNSVRQFSNIIWADTYAIGCARVIFQEQLPVADRNSKDTTTWTIERLVCNYGPGGGQPGKAIYKRGTSCENCPPGTQCSLVFPGLCALQSKTPATSEDDPALTNTPAPDADKDSQQNLEGQESKDDTTTESEPQEATSESSEAKDSWRDAVIPRDEVQDPSSTTSPSTTPPTTSPPSTSPPSKDTLSKDTPSKDAPSKDTRSKDAPKVDSPSKGAPNLDSVMSGECEGVGCEGGIFTSPTPSSGLAHVVQSKTKSSSGSRAVKFGVYTNGKCHCSDINRSGAGRGPTAGPLGPVLGPLYGFGLTIFLWYF